MKTGLKRGMTLNLALVWVLLITLGDGKLLADSQALVAANTAFAFQLYNQLPGTNDNLVVSPYSISSALAMTYAGARGETAAQMAKTLHFDKCPTNVPGQWKDLALAVTASAQGSELNIANSLWPQQHYRFLPDYLNLLESSYAAKIVPQDFVNAPDQAVTAINQWVDDQTKHKISQIVGPSVITPLTRLVLVNAIYFNGTWQWPFAESATRPDTFHNSAENAVTVPFMHQKREFQYGETPDAQLLSLPYDQGNLELTVILPRQVDGLASLAASLTPAMLTNWLAAENAQEVVVSLPKFKISTDVALANTLRAMGMADAFNGGQANFSGMDGQDHWLYLSAVLHKAYIDVNEHGTEAAAATAVTVTAMALPMRRPPEFRADHPFLFLLRDRATGSILFLGRVTNPAQVD